MEHFKIEEFACRCGSIGCDAATMREAFLVKLEELRCLWGKPMVITSGSRCRYWNSFVGGVPGSQHLLGNAADILVKDRAEAEAIANLAEQVGLGGIGISSKFIHLDNGDKRRWVYP